IHAVTAISDSVGWYSGAGTSFVDATITTTPRLLVGMDVVYYDRISAFEQVLNDVTTDQLQQIGTASPADGVAIGGGNFVLAAPAANSGTITEVTVYTSASGRMFVGVYDRTGDTFTLV